MLHLLDANVLIDADRDYYSIERVPEFWSWLQDQGERNAAKIPEEIYEEITAGRGDLSDWAKRSDVEAVLLLNEEVDIRLVRRATLTRLARTAGWINFPGRQHGLAFLPD